MVRIKHTTTLFRNLSPLQKISFIYIKWLDYAFQINETTSITLPIQKRYMSMLEQVETIHASSATGISEEEVAEFIRKMKNEDEQTLAYMTGNEVFSLCADADVKKWSLFCQRVDNTSVYVPTFFSPVLVGYGLRVLNPVVADVADVADAVDAVHSEPVEEQRRWYVRVRLAEAEPEPDVVLRRSVRKRNAIVRYTPG
jgi:hypothetical protein